MKTSIDIQNKFKATTKTFGNGNVYRCQVYRNEEMICEGLGSTPANAEDTAFYGMEILNKKSI